MWKNAAAPISSWIVHRISAMPAHRYATFWARSVKWRDGARDSLSNGGNQRTETNRRQRIHARNRARYGNDRAGSISRRSPGGDRLRRIGQPDSLRPDVPPILLSRAWHAGRGAGDPRPDR